MFKIVSLVYSYHFMVEEEEINVYKRIVFYSTKFSLISSINFNSLYCEQAHCTHNELKYFVLKYFVT